MLSFLLTDNYNPCHKYCFQAIEKPNETISFVTKQRIINNWCKKSVAEAIKVLVAPFSQMRSFSRMPFLASKRPANVISDVLPKKTCGYVFSQRAAREVWVRSY